MAVRIMLSLLLASSLIGMAAAGPKVICSDAGAGGYQAFPDVTRLANGDLICVFYAGYGHISLPNEQLPRGARIMAMRSTDNGKTWGKPVVAVDTPIDDRDPHIRQLADGTVMISFFTRLAPREKTGVERFEQTRNVYVIRSHDNGQTWDNLPTLVARHFACSAPVRQFHDGTLLLGVYTQDKSKTTRFYLSGIARSSDGGKTWLAPIMIPNSSGHSHDETDVTRLSSGRILAFMRPCMCSSTSDDGGLTWSDAKPVGFEGHAPCFLRTSKGILLVGHRLPNTSIHYSFDEGETWKGPVQLDSFMGAYPGFCELPDGRILAVYYEEGENSAIRQVTFRITESEVTFD